MFPPNRPMIGEKARVVLPSLSFRSFCNIRGSGTTQLGHQAESLIAGKGGSHAVQLKH
jgi:hypothetical protein